MTPETFIHGVFIVCPLIALAAVMFANRQDRRDAYQPDAPTFIYVPGAAISAVLLAVWLTSVVLYADVPAQDPCSLLEPYSWQWWLLGCYWGSAT